jgi:pimeloyl-ACP methyl ester carboxylesterase
VTTLEVVAGANHAAVTSILDRLRNGTLAAGVGGVEPACVVGAGQSMGGHVLAGMQADHRTFDAVAMLGSSMVFTTMPRKPGQAEIAIPDGASPEEAAALVTSETDWRFAFFWEDVPEALVETDLAGGHPVRQTAPIWGSTTWPGLATTLVLPGAVASEAARIDVPVLVALGERDLCRKPLEELAAFSSASDLAALVVPRMAHMHNFAGTRRRLWDRIDAFISQAVTQANGS